PSTISSSAPGWTGPSTWNSTAWRWCAPRRDRAPEPGRRDARRAARVAGGRRCASGVAGLGRRRRGGWRSSRLGGLGGGRIGLRRLGTVVTGQVALAVAVLLEVGFVPAAAGQAERRRGDRALHRGRAAGRAGRGIRVGKLLQPVEAVAALFAAERIDGHGDVGMEDSSRRAVWGRRSRIQGGRHTPVQPMRWTRGSFTAGRVLAYSCGALPQGAGGSSTGRVRSNSTRNWRPSGRRSS